MDPQSLSYIRKLYTPKHIILHT